MHRPAVFAAHGAVAQDGFERQAIFEHGAHHQQRVKPVSVLAREALGDEVGREPGAPVVRIGAVVQRRERHDAGVEPRITDVGNAADRFAAARASDLDAINPGPMG